jgi:hypothetical protein
VDGIDMDSDATTNAMELMDVAGRTMSADWGAVSTRLASLAGQLGQGELGAAYLDGYRQPAAETAAAVDQHCGLPGRLAAAGHQCIGIYRSADRAGADTFASSGPVRA